MVSVLLLFTIGCHPFTYKEGATDHDKQVTIEDETQPVSTNTQNQATTSSQPAVYVTAINTDSNVGNAAAANGVLNVKNDCLYMGDFLLIISSPDIIWTQHPFTIADGRKGTFRIGDAVLIGGSEMSEKSMDALDTDWKTPPLATCNADKIWLMNSIDKQ